MSRKRVIEASLPQDRAAQRRKLGSLRELTVQPATKRRYATAVDGFFTYLRNAGLSLPSKKMALDHLLCDDVEFLWSNGAGRGLANDTIAGLQDRQPDLRHHLPGAWRLLKTWSINEVPARAPPFPDHVVKAMSGWAFFKGYYSFGLSLLIGFYAMLRTGEVLSLRSSSLMCQGKSTPVVISLGMTKGGKRQGAAESVILGYEPVVRLIQQWKKVACPATPLVKSAAQWRKLFNECLESLELLDSKFRPYSLRRGGATYWFSQHQSLDRLLISGRWASAKTARIYINEGLAMLTTMHLPPSHPKVKPFIGVFIQTCQNLNFSTLEPPALTGRAGGRGRKKRPRTMKPKKGPFFFACWKSNFSISQFPFIGTSPTKTQYPEA